MMNRKSKDEFMVESSKFFEVYRSIASYVGIIVSICVFAYSVFIAQIGADWLQQTFIGIILGFFSRVIVNMLYLFIPIAVLGVIIIGGFLGLVGAFGGALFYGIPGVLPGLLGGLKAGAFIGSIISLMGNLEEFYKD